MNFSLFASTKSHYTKIPHKSKLKFDVKSGDCFTINFNILQ
jgi:hypothetical protein